MAYAKKKAANPPRLFELGQKLIAVYEDGTIASLHGQEFNIRNVKVPGEDGRMDILDKLPDVPGEDATAGTLLRWTGQDGRLRYLDKHCVLSVGAKVPTHEELQEGLRKLAANRLADEEARTAAEQSRALYQAEQAKIQAAAFEAKAEKLSKDVDRIAQIKGTLIDGKTGRAEAEAQAKPLIDAAKVRARKEHEAKHVKTGRTPSVMVKGGVVR